MFYKVPMERKEAAAAGDGDEIDLGMQLAPAAEGRFAGGGAGAGSGSGGERRSIRRHSSSGKSAATAASPSWMAKFAAEDFLSDAELGLGRRGQMRFDPDGLDDSAFESASDSKQQRREERRLERKASVAAADAGSGASSSSAAAASSAALNSRRAYEDDDDYEAFAGDGPSNGSEEDSSGSFGAAFGEDSASGTADTAPVRARGGRKKGSSGGGGAGSSSRRGKGKGSIVRPHYSFDLNDYLPDASVGADGGRGEAWLLAVEAVAGLLVATASRVLADTVLSSC